MLVAPLFARIWNLNWTEKKKPPQNRFSAFFTGKIKLKNGASCNCIHLCGKKNRQRTECVLFEWKLHFCFSKSVRLWQMTHWVIFIYKNISHSFVTFWRVWRGVIYDILLSLASNGSNAVAWMLKNWLKFNNNLMWKTFQWLTSFIFIPEQSNRVQSVHKHCYRNHGHIWHCITISVVLSLEICQVTPEFNL